MDKVLNRTAIRVLSQSLSVDIVSTQIGKELTLHNTPFCYAEFLRELITG